MLGISEQTVKNHFTHIYEKAWVPGRNEFKELFFEGDKQALDNFKQIAKTFANGDWKYVDSFHENFPT